MIERTPILQRIHDQFDAFSRYEHTDHSTISNIAIAGNTKGYQVVTYPGGSGTAFDPFKIEVVAPLFGDTEPSLVGVSRGVGVLSVKDLETETLGAGEGPRTGTFRHEPLEEQLISPEDPGFDMFLELHENMQAILPALSQALEPFGTDIDPVAFSMANRVGNIRLNHQRKRITHCDASVYEVAPANGPELVRIELDATQDIPFGEGEGFIGLPEVDPMMAYVSGNALIHGSDEVIRAHQVGEHALVSFGALHSTISQLYKQDIPRQ